VPHCFALSFFFVDQERDLAAQEIAYSLPNTSLQVGMNTDLFVRMLLSDVFGPTSQRYKRPSIPVYTDSFLFFLSDGVYAWEVEVCVCVYWCDSRECD
jgi:hypothetical protein